MRIGLGLFLIVFPSAAVFGQAPSPGATPGPAFEVASVKPNLRGPKGGMHGPGGDFKIEPNRLTMTNVTLRTCVRVAFDVKEYQVTGPGWMDDERFDINAVAAEAGSSNAIHLMLQRLLAERFKLETHRQTKEMPVYVLTVAKGGPKFHESKTDGEFSARPTGPATATFERATVAQLTDMLAQVLRMPVLDETGLKARYDVTVDMTSYIPENKEHGPGAAPPDIAGIVMAALPEQLGLKLDSRKAPLDLIVVDHAERAPTEN